MSVRILTAPQGSPRWLDVRRRRVTATDVGKLAQVSPHGGPGDVWADKLGYSEPFALGDLWSEAALALEPVAVRAWSRETKAEAVKGPVLVETDGYRLASLDYADRDRDEPIDVKVRVRGSPEWDLWTDGTIPEDVADQLDQQGALLSALTGRRIDVAHAAVILASGFSFEFRAYRLDLRARREAYESLAADFGPWWTEYVATRTPPPEATYRNVAAVVDVTCVKRREPTEAEAAMLARWVAAEAKVSEARAALKVAEAARDVPKSDLARSLGLDYMIPGASWTKHATPQLRLTSKE